MRHMAEGETQECEGCNRLATGWCEDGLPWCDECGRWNLNIGQAVALMKKGKCVMRPSWNGKDMYLYLSEALTLHDGTLSAPIVMMRTADGSHVAWTCSQTDLLATDWMDEESN